MQITKYGHSCLLIETDGVKILTDPGSYSNVPEGLGGLTAILISHAHQDHFQLDLLSRLVADNPKAVIYTNPAVGRLLEEAKIAYDPLVSGGSIGIEGIAIEAHGDKHAVMHPDVPLTENTGFFIDNALFMPGDGLTMLNKEVEILALPVAGPWLKLSEAIEYAKAVRPKVCFPIHDGILKQPGSTSTIPPVILEPLGIDWRVLEEGVPLVVDVAPQPAVRLKSRK